MNAIGTAAVAIGALALSAIAPMTPAFAGQRGQVQSDDAVIVPTAQEVQQRMQVIADDLRAAQLASASPTQASDYYLSAQREYAFGMYDQAMAYLDKARRAMPADPNWVDPVNLAAR